MNESEGLKVTINIVVFDKYRISFFCFVLFVCFFIMRVCANGMRRSKNEYKNNE